MTIEKFKVTEPYLEVDTQLGEGPLTSTVLNDTLYFLDCVKGTVNSVNVKEGPSSYKLVAQLESVNCLANVEGHDNLLAFVGRKGFGLLDVQSGKWKWIKELWSEEEKAQGQNENKGMNDGGVDSKGRFWAGSMQRPNLKAQEEPKRAGHLFRLDSDLSLHRMFGNVGIPNGISWSLDDKTMYWTDSVDCTIWGFDYDAHSGSVSNRREFYRQGTDIFKDGTPDGHCQDEHGYIWSAICGSSKVVRLSPKGEVVAEVEVPAKYVSACAIVGTDLYMTSISESIFGSNVDPASLGGRLFKCPIGVRGKKPNNFRLDDQFAKL